MATLMEKRLMSRQAFCCCVGIFVFGIISSLAVLSQAAVITVPVGLSPGDEYRLVFLTSTQRDSVSTNLADYNAFVTSAALAVPELAALGTTWSVIGSTADVDARDNTGTNPTVSSGVPFYRLDGELVANDNNDLWDGSPAAAIDVYESGDAAASTRWVWTGTGTDGREFSPLGSGSPSVGGSIIEPALPYLWIRNYAPPGNSEPLNFYAVSGVLTVVPEPGSLVLGGLGLLAVIGCGVRRRKVA